MSALKSSLLAGAALIVLAGCGGGQSSGMPASTTIRIGQASVTYTGSAKPFVSQGSGSITVTGMSGASYSTIGLIPVQTLDNTLILYTEGPAIYTVPGSGGTPTEVTKAGIFGVDGTFTNDGHILVQAYATGNCFLRHCGG